MPEYRICRLRLLIHAALSSRLIVGDNSRALQLAEKSVPARLLGHAIRPPTVPAGTARLRLTLTAAHEMQRGYRLSAGGGGQRLRQQLQRIRSGSHQREQHADLQRQSADALLAMSAKYTHVLDCDLAG